MRLRDVRHQERALSILRRALRSGRTHHAYLFEGPEGVGKELTARVLAARLLCQADQLVPDADACGRCESCRLLTAGNHPDFHLIHRGLHKLHPDRAIRASKGLFLSVDVVRHFLIEPAAMTPSLGRARVFLIRDAERMNEEAQNALLKTLEEPPGNAGLILVTSSASRLRETIRSRCQRIPFDLLPAEFVEEQLVSQAAIDQTAARTLARLSDGRLGAALHWHRVGLLGTLDAVADALRHVSAGDPERFGQALVEAAEELATPARTRTAEEIEAEAAEIADDEAEPKGRSKGVSTDVLRETLKLVFLLIATLHRDALLTRVGAPAQLLSLPQQRRLVDRLARETETDQLESAIRAVAQAEESLDRNVAPQLVCERLAVALAGELPVA